MDRTAYEVIKEFLEENDYLIVDADDGCFTVKYQMNTIGIYPDSQDPNFCSVLLPNFIDIDDDNRLHTIIFFNMVNATQKVVKAYLTENDSPVITYEFNYEDEQDLKYQVEKGLESVLIAKAKFRKLRFDYISNHANDEDDNDKTEE